MSSYKGYRPLSLHVSYRRRFDRLFYVALFLFVFVLIGTFIPIHFKPSETNAVTGIANPSVLTFSSISSVSSVSLVVDSNAGSFATSNNDEKIKFSISTNNYTGYTLKIKTASNNSNLTKGDYSLSSISSITTYTDFRNPVNTTYDNKWGFIPSKYASGNIIVNNTNAYLPAPDMIGTTLNVTTSANSSDGVTNPDEYTIGVGARVNYDVPEGNYSSSTMILEYVANPVLYSITYDANDGDGGNNTTNMPSPNPQTGSVNGGVTTMIISNSVPIRAGYDFKGWCTVQVADDASCTGTEYQPGATYGIDYTAINTPVLYARWQDNSVSLTITFVRTGISSVKVCTVGGDCSGANLKGTVSTSGDSVSGLSQDTTYYLYPVLSSGRIVESWKKTSVSGVLDGVATQNTVSNATNPSFMMTNSNSTVILTSRGETLLMQEIDQTNKDTYCPAGVHTTAYDARDGKAYTIRQIDGVCTMTKNLQYIGGTNGSVSAGNGLNSAGDTFTMEASNMGSRDIARYIVSNNDDYGVYYNFAAASGGTVTSITGPIAATTSICPAGWSLPGVGENSWGGMSLSNIKNYGNYNIRSGSYTNTNNGGETAVQNPTLIGSGGVGYWWGSGAYNEGSYYALWYNGSTLAFSNHSQKTYYYVPLRCIIGG